MFPANPFRLKGSCPRFTNPASTSVVKSVAKRPDSEQCCCLQSETMSGNSRSWKESAVKTCYNIRVQASMLIQMHSWIFGRLLHVWLFWNQSIYIYRFYGLVQIPECWPRLWDVPGAKCMEISPCRYTCCATMKLCDGQCCSRCGVHSVSKKTCCLGDGDDHCELVGPQPHAHQGTVVVVAIGLGLVLLVLLVLSLSCLFLRRFHSVREPLLNPPQPAVSLLDLASNGPRGQVVAPTRPTSTTTSIPGGQVVAPTSTTTSIPGGQVVARTSTTTQYRTGATCANRDKYRCRVIVQDVNTGKKSAIGAISNSPAVRFARLELSTTYRIPSMRVNRLHTHLPNLPTKVNKWPFTDLLKSTVTKQKWQLAQLICQVLQMPFCQVVSFYLGAKYCCLCSEKIQLPLLL